MVIVFKKSLIIVSSLLIFVVLFGCSTKGKNDNAQPDELQKVATTENDSAKYTVDELSNAILSNDTEKVSKIIQSKTVDINQKNSDGKYPIEIVFVMNNCEMAEKLLDAGANPQVVTSNGETVYDIAVNKGNKTLKAIFEKYK